MKIVDFSIRRPVTVSILAVAGIVFGLVAFQRLPTDLLPDLTYPSLTVRTVFDGAAPFEVESLVTRPVEDVVGVVNGVTRVTSSSRADTSEVTLEFTWGTDMDIAGLDVRERLDVLDLPDETDRPILLRYDPSLDPILRIGLTGSEGDGAQEGDDDLIRLRRIAEDEVQRALERLEGVAAVVVSGGLEEEIQVEVDERRLANLGLDVDLVTQRLAQENVNLTGGRLRQGRAKFLVRTVNEILRPEDLNRLVISRQGEANVLLEDVARVRRGHREREIITRIDGRESIEVAVYKEGGTNTVTVSDTVRANLDTLRAELRKVDPNLDLTLITDQARFIRNAVAEVLEAALWGGLLAVLVLFLFLGNWRSTLVIGLAIPISVVTTFFLMYAFGVSLNIMSLGGLTLGIGLLVDNAIVVLEAIQRRRDLGLGAVEAARAGAGEVGRAVVASTLTTLCVFVPIVFVEGVAGQLFGDQALTVTFSLIVSLAVALTILPMAVSRSLGNEAEAGPGDEQHRGLFFRGTVAVARAVALVLGALGRVIHLLTTPVLRMFQAGFGRIEALYDRALPRLLRRAGWVLVAAVVLLALSLLLYPRLGRELIPEMVQGEIFVDAEMPPGTPLETTSFTLRQVEQAARAHPEITEVYGLAGTSNEQGGVAGELRENLGQVTFLLTPPVSRQREDAVMADLRATLDRQEGLTYRFGRPAYFSFQTPIELEVRGYNLELLDRLSDQIVEGLAGIPGLTDIKASTEGGNPELRIRFDRERLATLGVGLADAAAAIRTKVNGTVATDIQRRDRTIDVRVRAQENFRDSTADLLSLAVERRGKTSIPLSAVAQVEEVEGPADIRRAEGERVAILTANLDGRDLASASGDITDLMNTLRLPEGFDWELGGQRREMATSYDSLRLALLLAVFLVYLVMASQFESFLHPLVILCSVPFSVVGALGILWLFDVAISIVVLIGMVMLAGIVVNNAILLVDTANRLRRNDGLGRDEAIAAAGKARLRPILMTTATTVFGLTPMAIGLGEGSELRTPMALTVIGGLAVSTLLTLVVLPAFYRLVERE
ncbi:MAG: efflux RND transporter permease subunit [Acidobacteriota bacterium]